MAFIPKGSMCMNCRYKRFNCKVQFKLDYSKMKKHSTYDGHTIVICDKYEKHSN